MGRRLCLLVVIVLIAACERNPPAPPAVPSPAPTLKPAAPSTPSARLGESPAPAVSPQADDASDDDDDDIDKPWGSEFEIDADANWYFGFAPMNVSFTAHALNGSPPYSYTWDFADGSPTTTGDHAEHVYEKVGRYASFVVGTDANGEHYQINFLIIVVTKEEYATTKGIDPQELRQLPLPSPTPASSP